MEISKGATIPRGLRDGAPTLVGIVVTAGVLATGCSSSGNGDAGTSGGNTVTVTISGYTFSPDPVVVPPGAILAFKNTDNTAHTATSEAAAGLFMNGQVDGGFTFDTASIGPNAIATLTVPSTIASGTLQPYFCTFHKGMMANPNPVIQIQ
jgi:plastocyanin